MDNYVKRIRTVDGDLQIDYKSLANLPDLTPNGLGMAPVKHTHNADDISGVIPIEKGGTGNKIGNAASATKLETARNLSVDLANGDSISFDGTEDKQLGVSGILPIANGGTEKGTRAEAIENLISAGYTSDANTALSVGTYSTNAETTNIPFQTYGTLFTYKPNQDWIVQIWASTNSTETCLYLRKNTNSDGFGNWFKILGDDIVLTMAQGGTGATKLEDVQKNIFDGTYPAEGTDILALAPGVYCLPNNTTTAMNAPLDAWSPISVVLGHRDSSNGDDGYPTGNYFQMFVEWDGNLWLRRRKWNIWGEWKKIFSSSGGEITGDLTISKAGGFNYSGIEEGTNDAFRNVWFSDTSAKGKPCYNNGLMYNPVAQDLAVGGHSVYHTGNIDIQVGTLAVGTSGTTLTFPRAFAGTPVVTANSSNQTSVKVENVSATSVKLTAGTSGSTVQWQAIYIP